MGSEARTWTLWRFGGYAHGRGAQWSVKHSGVTINGPHETVEVVEASALEAEEAARAKYEDAADRLIAEYSARIAELEAERDEARREAAASALGIEVGVGLRREVEERERVLLGHVRVLSEALEEAVEGLESASPEDFVESTKAALASVKDGGGDSDGKDLRGAAPDALDLGPGATRPDPQDFPDPAATGSSGNAGDGPVEPALPACAEAPASPAPTCTFGHGVVEVSFDADGYPIFGGATIRPDLAGAHVQIPLPGPIAFASTTSDEESAAPAPSTGDESR